MSRFEWVTDDAILSVLEQPLKIPFVASTVLVANALKPEVVSDVLKKFGESLQAYIDSGSWREVKLLLRFLGCIQCLFEGDGVFPILEELFARAVDLQTASSEDVSSADFGYSIVVGMLANGLGIAAWVRTREDHSVHHSVCHRLARDGLRVARQLSPRKNRYHRVHPAYARRPGQPIWSGKRKNRGGSECH